MEGLYKLSRRIISPEESTRISDIICAQPTKTGDEQVPNSSSYYGLAVCNTLLGLLCSRVSEMAGKHLSPTYSYCRVYYKGAILLPHKDRPSCEYSVTLNLAQTHKWPIFMGEKAIDLQPGDACLYKGCEIEHSRREFEGDMYVQVFLHYIDSHGPYRNHIHDIENHLYIRNNNQDFKKINSNASSVYTHDNSFDDAECATLCTLQTVPKTQYYEGVYKKIIQYVDSSNNEFFKFEISEIEKLEILSSSLEEHMDVEPGANSRRKLTIIVQLSEASEYEGGEVNLSRKVNVPKLKGTIIIFPSYMWYSILPIIKGSACFLRGWVTGPPFR
jgi:hypothetical protein